MTTCTTADLSADGVADVSDKDISRAIGAEMRLAREAKGWARATVVKKMRKPVGERTLLSYEHGTRHMSVPRLVDICAALDVGVAGLVQDAMQRARLELESQPLRVDVRMVIHHRNEQFRPMVQWARNKLNDNPEGVVEVAPVAVLELATFIGSTHKQLANYLAQFMPNRADTCTPRCTPARGT